MGRGGVVVNHTRMQNVRDAFKIIMDLNDESPDAPVKTETVADALLGFMDAMLYSGCENPDCDNNLYTDEEMSGPCTCMRCRGKKG